MNPDRNSLINKRFFILPHLLLVAWVAICAGQGRSPATAQILGLQQTATGDLPDRDYWLAFGPYFDGDFRRAENDFASGARTALKAGSSRFLDSCCYYVMVGETSFHLGNYPAAVTQYEEALRLYLQFTRDNWQSRVIQPNIVANNSAIQRAQITWYQPQRNVTIPGLPDTMQMMFGRLDAERAFVEGGAVQNAEMRKVNVVEIMRTVAVALQRRRWIKGDICQHDPFSRQILDGLKRTGTADLSLLSKCNQVLLGLALAGNGDIDRARETLAASLQFGGGMDHPLTPIAMLELARLQLQQGDTVSAASMALEASWSAAVFNQFDIVEQSLSLGAEIHLRTRRDLYPPLPQAIAWANRNRARHLQVSLAIRQADCQAEAGAAAASLELLDEAQRLGTRSDILRGPLSGRLEYLRAVNQFALGKFDDGLQSLASGLKNYSAGSRWLYQIGLINSLVANSGITVRQADLLYGLLLGDPQEIHWRTDPVECMSYLASSHLPAIEAWLDIAIENRAYDRAIEIAELLRRHRFFATQPLAGRLVSMRWVMHGPAEAVGEQALAQRADFLTRLPQYADLVQQATAVRQNLTGIPLRPAPESDREKEQRDLFVQLMQISSQQESLLASHCLKREPATMLFAPTQDLSALRSSFGPNQQVLYGIQTERNCHLFEISVRGSRLLASHKVREIGPIVGRILKALSLTEKQLTAEQLKGVEWKKEAWELVAKLLPGFAPGAGGTSQGLLIVPDGPLWNLPFEALPFGATAEATVLLGDLCVPTYAPTAYLGLERARRWKQPLRTSVFVGQLDKGLPIEPVRETVAKMTAGLTDAAVWEDRLMIPGSLLGSVTDRAMVLTGMDMARKGGPFALLPFQKDVGRSGNSLASWLTLPFDGTDTLLMPCFESQGAYGLSGADTGQDVFLTSMALIASGSRTLLISRWPTRGQSTLQLSEEFLARSAEFPPAVALQKASQWLRKQPVEFAKELRLKTPTEPVEIVCEHPFFWAGYMVFDLPATNQPEWSGLAVKEDDAGGPANQEMPAPAEVKGGEGDEAEIKPDEAAPEAGLPKPEVPAADPASPTAPPSSSGNGGGGGVISQASGGVVAALLNHRLMAGNPPGS